MFFPFFVMSKTPLGAFPRGAIGLFVKYGSSPYKFIYAYVCFVLDNVCEVTS